MVVHIVNATTWLLAATTVTQMTQVGPAITHDEIATKAATDMVEAHLVIDITMVDVTTVTIVIDMIQTMIEGVVIDTMEIDTTHGTIIRQTTTTTLETLGVTTHHLER